MISFAVYWKLAVWKAASGLALVLFGVMPSLVLNWDTMTGQGRTVAVFGVIVAGLKFLDGFFDQTFSRLAQGKSLVPLPGLNGNGNGNGNTEVLIKTTTTTAVSDKPPEEHK